MHRSHRAFGMAALMLSLLLAGCTSAPPEEEILLQESLDVGIKLYSWADGNYSKGSPHGRNIRADFEVPGDIQRLGVRFAGHYHDTHNASAVLSITDPAGNRVVRLNATPGNEDDFGAITSFWNFERVVPGFTGTWDILVEGRGVIQQLDFRVQGIERRETTTQRGFVVDDDSRPITARVLFSGFGPTPDVYLDLPNGTARPITLDTYGEMGTLTLDAPATGQYRIRAETTDWGGHVAFQVKQAAG